MVVIGRECGMGSKSPRCSLRSRNLASTLAAAENGGDFTSLCSHANGLCFGLTKGSICQNRHIINGSPNYAFERSVPRGRAAGAKGFCARGANSGSACSRSTRAVGFA